LLLALVGGVLAASLAALILALTKGDQTQQSVALGLAFGSIALTVAKILLDMFVSPSEQALTHRRGRHEERVESVAGRVRQLLGLQGSMLLGHVEDAWQAGDANAVRDHANVLADAAALAYHECESASDALEILVGVLMVEARELRDDAEVLASVPLCGVGRP
jgi:hypothetical protein